MSTERRPTRRDVLVAGAAATGALAGIQAAPAFASRVHRGQDEPFSALPKDVVLGRLTAVWQDRQLELKTPEGATRVVQLAPDVHLWKDEPVSLDAFTLGEELVVEGTDSDDTFVGTAVINLVHGIEDRITTARGERRGLTGGTLRLTKHTRYQDEHGLQAPRPEHTAPGARVKTLVRIDPAAAEFVAVRLYDPADAGA